MILLLNGEVNEENKAIERQDQEEKQGGRLSRR
jgi:hypothetical protein